MNNILLLEDDPGIGKTVEFNLQDEGYTVFWAKDIKSARKVFIENSIDLILLDIGLPDGNGLDFCEEIRDVDVKIPILILTATLEEESAVKSFEKGADDYIRKPFGIEELIARVKRHLNIKVSRDIKIKFNDLTIIPDKREAFCGQHQMHLNRREFDILQYFVKNPNRVLSRNDILNFLDIPEEVNDRTIDSHVSHLRSTLKKLAPLKHKISSVYGVGYKLEKQ